MGGVDRSLSRHRLAASQPDIGSDPTHILPFHSLRAKGRHAPTGRRSDPTELEHQLKRCSTARPVRATQATSSLPAGYALVGFTGPEPGDAPETAVENECPLVANTNPLSALWQHPPRGGGDKSEK